MTKYGETKSSVTDSSEHVQVGLVNAKRVLMSGWDGSSINDVNVDSNGNLTSSESLPYGADYVSVGYTGSNITSVVYKVGGSGGTTIATLTIAYSGNNITSITKT